jgi:hypothetical protein
MGRRGNETTDFIQGFLFLITFKNWFLYHISNLEHITLLRDISTVTLLDFIIIS